MELREYLDGLERGGAARFAAAINVTPSYLSQLAAGTTPRSPARCVQIELATGGKVSRKDLRPDDWHEIWPELGPREVVAKQPHGDSSIQAAE